MKSSELDGLFGLVLEDPRGISEADDYPTAHKAIRHYCRVRGYDEAVTIAQHSPFGSRSLLHLTDDAKPFEIKALVTGMIRSAPDLWGNRPHLLNPSVLPSILGEEQSMFVVDYLLKDHRDFIRSDHPLAHAIDLDLYWSMKISNHIKRSSWKRAWDEVKKAVAGVQLPSDPSWLRTNRRVYISPESLGPFIDEMFEGIGTITQPAADEILGRRSRQRVYEVRKPSGHRYTPRAYEQRVERPGWRVACHLAKIRLNGLGDPFSREDPVFDETARKAFALGEHFANKRNDKRRKRWQKLSQAA